MDIEREHRDDEPKEKPSDSAGQERFDPWEDQFQRDYRPSDREFDF
jgi:hypothetical protein